jgi:hypothetical protein
MLARNDEDVDWGHRVDVREGIAEFILIDGGGWDGSIDDFAEETGHSATSRARSFYNRAVE